MPVIFFNGKTYNSLDEMPANERQAFDQLSTMFVDKDGNGIPDFLEGDMAKNVMTAFTSSVNLNGQTYNGLNELPPEVRAKVQGAFQKLSELGIVTKDSPGMIQVQAAQTGQTQMAPSQPLVTPQFSPAIQDDKKSSPMMWVVVGLGLALCATLAFIAVFVFSK
jgi:hypothetical protein